MKKTLFFGLLVIVMAYGFISCENDSGDITPKTVTYSGVSEGITFSLKIIEEVKRSVYLPQNGDNYELKASGKTSSGNVSLVSGATLTLIPSNSSTTFTATVSGNNLIAMAGTITWSDNTTLSAPSTLTSGSSGNDTLNVNNVQIYLLNNTSTAFTGSGTVKDESEVVVLGSISNGKLTLNFPEFVPENQLQEARDWLNESITVSPSDIKTTSFDYDDGFIVNGEFLLYNMKVSNNSTDYFFYLYSNKAGVISGTKAFVDEDDGVKYTETFSIVLKTGWNQIWVHHDRHIFTWPNNTVLKSDLNGMPSDLKWLIIGG